VILLLLEDSVAMKRRTWIAATGSFLLCSGATANAQTPLDVAYAGSMTSVMEGAIKQAAAAELKIALQGRAQGASGLAQLIVSNSIRPDVFISVTPGPMQTVLKAGLAEHAAAIAHTEMVIAYNPKGRFAPKFAPASWWQVLQETGLRFGRTDPVTDPQGRNIIFVMQLAALHYRQPDLARRILGPDINPQQIFTEPTIESRLQSGELDAASGYKIQPAAFGLPYVTLPEEVNLGSARFAAQYQRAGLTLNGQIFHPEPLVYYTAALKNAAHPAEAARFCEWLAGDSAQAIFRKFSYDPPGEAGPLRA
jgi:molybdate/tungstate transport system substrate-binding protein